MKNVVVAALALSVLGGASARGQGCPPRYEQDFDQVTPPVLPANWTATQGVNVTGAPFWVTSTITPDTPPNSVFSTAPDNILDNRLDAPAIFAGDFDDSITFRHSYDLEEGFDGAVLEISTPSINGGAFTDVTDPAVGGSFSGGGGYNSTISAASQSPIAGRMAWSGNSNGYVSVQLFLGFIDQNFFDNVVLRFRLATDNSGASTGWRIDTFRWHHNECNPPIPTPTATAAATATPPATPTPTATPSPPATPSPTVTPSPPPGPAQALNISTRLRVETGDRIAIGGFIITGNEPKKVAIRAIGPWLTNFGLTDVLADPTLELRDNAGVFVGANDDWQDDPASAGELTALGLALQDPNESGMVVTLEPGNYTALMAGKNQTSGIGVVEIYDADPAAASQLANISTRGFVRTGDNVMIGGFILGQGSASTGVVVRGLGPSLSQFGLNNVLADPTLELRDSNGALLMASDNWQDDPASAGQLIRFGLFPANPKESAIFTTLPPGAFTAILAGKSGTVGLGLVEIYSDVHAETLIVTNTADNGAGSLRDTIAAAGNGNMIQFDPALNGATINVTSAELVIDKNITISGPGPDALAVSKQNFEVRFRVFHVMPGHTVTIAGIRISGGDADFEQPGGGILNDDSRLTISNCEVSFNSTFSGGGGIYSGGAGAILTIFDSTVSSNRAFGSDIENTQAGGGIFNNGTLKISNSNISNNYFQTLPFFQGKAGGIFNAGAVEISNSTISGNVGGSGNDGIINRGSMLITNSTFSAVGASNDGGIFLESGTFQVGNSILKADMGVNIFSGPGTVASLGYNLSSDDGGGFLTATGDQINTDPMLGPLQDNGGPTFTHALLSDSPALDAGDPNFAPPPLWDQRGLGYDRVVNGRIDAGSFEVQSSATPAPGVRR